MAVSRSALEFLERRGLTVLQVPGPRLSVGDLLVHGLPLDPAREPAQAVLEGYEGDPAPDRGSARPWPNQGAV